MKPGYGITLSYAASLLLQGIYDDGDGGETADHATARRRRQTMGGHVVRREEKEKDSRSAFGCGNRALPTGKVAPSLPTLWHGSRQTDHA